MHLTSIRYQVTPEGPWKNALAEGSLNAVAIELQTHNVGSHTTFTEYESGELREVQAVAVRLPNGRVYDALQSAYIEDEEKARA